MSAGVLFITYLPAITTGVVASVQHWREKPAASAGAPVEPATPRP
jgi:hypothetical protein